MDSNTLTHVAAIVIGVLVTLAMMGIFSSKSTAESTSSESNGSSSQKKKKKRNKSNKKAASKENTEVTAEETPVKEEATKQEVPVAKGNNNGNSNGSSNGNNASKKKAKKAKNKGPSNVNGAAKEKEVTQAVAAPAPVVPSPVKPKPTVYSSASDSMRQAPVEDEWNSVGGAKKKKKKVRTPGTVAAASGGATTATDSISVDARKVGIIIGPKGATMIALQEATGCKLDINAPSRDVVPSRNAPAAKAGVVITGDNKESIQIAKKAVMELATKGYATILQSENFGEFGTEVHPRMLSEIVGPNGKTIQAIQTTLSVKITIPPTDWKPNNKNNREVVRPAMVGIAGSKENSKAAKTVIQSLVKYHHHEVTHPGMIHKMVHVPQEFFHCVIGVRGSEIKHIRGNYKVDMYMPNEDSVSDDVMVVGRPANVDKAITYIQLLMDRDADQREQKYSDEYY